MTIPDNREEMLNELYAWQRTNEALAEVGRTWDDWLTLHSAVVYWGECLVQLRVTQTEEQREKALAEAAHNYRRYHGEEIA